MHTTEAHFHYSNTKDGSDFEPSIKNGYIE